MIKFIQEFPLSYFWYIDYSIPKKARTLLDLGTGKGELALYIKKRRKLIIDGVEIYKPYVDKLESKNIYRRVIVGDIRKKGVVNKKYDIILCSQVLEHLPKDEALRVIKMWEKYAKKCVIVGVPNGKVDQSEYDGNKHQQHLSTWSRWDLANLGYRVYGQGAGWVYCGDNSSDKSLINRLLLFLIGYLLSPYYRFFPEKAAHLIAVKVIK